MYKQIDIFSDLIALQLGVVHPTIAGASKEERPRSIDEALASMSDDEARACKRKFRKILRSCKKKSKSSVNWNNLRRRNEVALKIRGCAWDMLLSSSNQHSDNDE
jgi:hypothetical protein